MTLAVFLVPPSTLEIAGFAGLALLFALTGLLVDSASRRQFQGSRGQYAAALGINAAFFLAPLFLWLLPVVRAGRAQPFELLMAVALALGVAYVLLRLVRMLPGVGPMMLALDQARRQQRLGGAA